MRVWCVVFVWLGVLSEDNPTQERVELYLMWFVLPYAVMPMLGKSMQRCCLFHHVNIMPWGSSTYPLMRYHYNGFSCDDVALSTCGRWPSIIISCDPWRVLGSKTGKRACTMKTNVKHPQAREPLFKRERNGLSKRVILASIFKSLRSRTRRCLWTITCGERAATAGDRIPSMRCVWTMPQWGHVPRRKTHRIDTHIYIYRFRFRSIYLYIFATVYRGCDTLTSTESQAATITEDACKGDIQMVRFG